MSKREKSPGWRRLPVGREPTHLLQFWEAAVFRRAWDDLGLDSDDLLDLQMQIILRPSAAPLIPGTGGLRKLRFSPAGWRAGKSGALRVCYVYFEEAGEVLLVLVYAKSERDDLNSDEKAAARAQIARQEALYAQRKQRRSPPSTSQ